MTVMWRASAIKEMKGWHAFEKWFTWTAADLAKFQGFKQGSLLGNLELKSVHTRYKDIYDTPTFDLHRLDIHLFFGDRLRITRKQPCPDGGFRIETTLQLNPRSLPLFLKEWGFPRWSELQRQFQELRSPDITSDAYESLQNEIEISRIGAIATTNRHYITKDGKHRILLEATDFGYLIGKFYKSVYVPRDAPSPEQIEEKIQAAKKEFDDVVHQNPELFGGPDTPLSTYDAFIDLVKQGDRDCADPVPIWKHLTANSQLRKSKIPKADPKTGHQPGPKTGHKPGPKRNRKKGDSTAESIREEPTQERNWPSEHTYVTTWTKIYP